LQILSYDADNRVTGDSIVSYGPFCECAACPLDSEPDH